MSATPQPAAAPPDRPLRSRRAWAALLVTTALGLITDLASKYIAFASIADNPVRVDRDQVIAVKQQGASLGLLIPPHEPVRAIPGLLDFTLVLNPGAVFGIGAGKRWFFVAFTCVALAVSAWMFARWTRARDTWAHVGLGLLVSGGLGNLYDRLVYACVRDFIHPLPGARFPFNWRNPLTGQRELWPYVSNLADLYLLVGILILLAVLWRRDRAMQKHAKPTTAPSAPAAQLQN